MNTELSTEINGAAQIISDEKLGVESESSNDSRPSILNGLDALFDSAKTIEFNPHNSVVAMRKHALALGELGFKIFPVHYMTQRPFGGGEWECSCCGWSRYHAKKDGDPNREIACSNSPGKHPRSKWKAEATDDADMIRELWSNPRKHPAANIAIATGQSSGIYVVDLDGKVGMDSLRALEAKHGALPKTLMAFSGRGDGLHLYFKTPAEAEGLTISAGTIGAGIDTRGTGGYIVAPGSNHKSLRRYMWVPGYGPGEVESADLPEWFIEAMKAASVKTAEQRAADRAAKGSKGEKAPKGEDGPADPFDAFTGAADDILSGGWTIRDGEELSGLEAYLARIGEEGDGYDGFHTPIYQALCSLFHRDGLGVSDDEAKELLVPAILAAPCKDGRNAKRYAKDFYLDQRIADAREFIGLSVKQEAERIKVISTRVEEIVASFTAETDAKEFERTYKMVSSVKMPPIKRKAIVDKLVKLTGLTAVKVGKAIDEHADRAASDRAAKKERAKRKEEAASVHDGGMKPRLDVMKDDFDFMVEMCKASMNAANKGAAMRFFNVGNEKTRLTFPDPDGRQKTELMDAGVLWSELNAAAQWVNGPRGVAADKKVAEELDTQWGFSFPPLKAIVASPVFDAEGSLIATPGYHAKSGIFYNPPKDFVLPPIPERPTKEEAFKARDLILNHVLPDFPFSDAKKGNDRGDSSRAHTMALLLQQFMRPMFPGNIPLIFTQKPDISTGATLMIQMVLYIPHGRIIGAQTEAKDNDELKKQLTASGMESQSVVWIDNVNNHLHGSALSNWATCGVWEDRILGRSEKVRFPVTCTTVLSGNNMRASREVGRRCLLIFMDAARDVTNRSGFTHDLERYVPANRAELVAACLTMIRYWIQLDKPMWKGEVLKSFAGYSRVMGGLLECLEIPGFLENRRVMMQAAAAEDEDWKLLLPALFDRYGAATLTALEIYTVIAEMDLTIKGLSGDDAADRARSLGTRMSHMTRKTFTEEVGGRSFRIMSETLETGKRGTDNKGLWRDDQVIVAKEVLAAEDMLGGLTEEDWEDMREEDDGFFPEEDFASYMEAKSDFA